MPVLGLGGFFWRAKDPGALKAWYSEHLGVGGGHGANEAGESEDWYWYPEFGPIVFEPFDAATDYFPPEKQFMLNLRVRDLDGLAEQLKAAGIEVITKEEWNQPGVGRFARIHDPEGTAIELWEPSEE